MKPAARYQAAIEVLDSIQSGTAAEKALTGWARRSRFAGSKDRAAVRDHVFDVIRRKRSCAALGGGDAGRALILGLLKSQDIDPQTVFTGEGHAPAALSGDELAAGRLPDPDEALDLPDWLLPQIKQALGDQAAAYGAMLRDRAPVILRVNSRKASRAQAVTRLSADGVEAEEIAISPTALMVTEGARRVSQSACYQSGVVELQDGASQALVDQLPLEDGQHVLDFCAGGGGKTLAMAGRVRASFAAHDAHAQRLQDLPNRAKRAGIKVQIIERPTGPYDLVLCDVPCSGSGSWRRSPEGKWSLTQTQLTALTQTQRDILQQAKDMVTPGGYLAYATCSVLPVENQEAIDQFLAQTDGWTEVSRQSWLPSAEGDGFFLSVLKADSLKADS